MPLTADQQKKLDSIVDNRVEAFLEQLDEDVRDAYSDEDVQNTLSQRFDPADAWADWTDPILNRER